ncbi:MAG: hypothetical protein LC714_00615 [Actinobacteria bacterium]|nr:hypothetical protein [Actinomycetota bacterium]
MCQGHLFSVRVDAKEMATWHKWMPGPGLRAGVFRDAVPATLVEEFDRLEPEALSAIERLKETVSG